MEDTVETENVGIWGTGEAVSVIGSNRTWAEKANMAKVQHRESVPAFEQCCGMGGDSKSDLGRTWH